MLELGDDTVHEHDAIGRVVVRLNISRLIVVGAGARAMHTGAVMEGSWGDESMWVATPDEAHRVLEEQLEPGDLVLFKSSNGAGLRFLGDRVALESVVGRSRGGCSARFRNRRGRPGAVIALLIGSALALVLSLLGTPLFIKLLVKKGYGQFIRDDGPTAHHTKRGTPTMGGVVIVATVVVAYFATHLGMWLINGGAHQGPTASGGVLLLLMAGMGLVGFLDDFIKISSNAASDSGPGRRSCCRASSASFLPCWR